MKKTTFERFRTFCSDCSSMSSLLDIIGKGARAIRYSSDINTNPEDYVMFCDELEESLELVSRMQRNIADSGWELLEIMEPFLQED